MPPGSFQKYGMQKIPSEVIFTETFFPGCGLVDGIPESTNSSQITDPTGLICSHWSLLVQLLSVQLTRRLLSTPY